LICETYLLENGIAQGDRLSMASSVELRLPLLDYRLVELVIGLRKAQADHRRPPKHWLKEAVKDVVPPWVMGRVKKGFAPPVASWYDALFVAYGEQLDGGYLVSHDVLSAEMGRYLSTGPRPAGSIMPLSFKALVLEQWCRQMSDLDIVGRLTPFTPSREHAGANS
jgi:asparagine synthase (glutamine-hydrolysing)